MAQQLMRAFPTIHVIVVRLPTEWQNHLASDGICFRIPLGMSKARLSMALRSKGFSCFSIDSVGHKGVPILRLNLLRENDLSILSELISQHVILYAHFGPPCGTSSAARGIPVNGRPGPPKLRSMQHTMGLKTLTGKDKHRVLSANRLYEITVALIFQLHEAGAYWSVENPASSMMWVT